MVDVMAFQNVAAYAEDEFDAVVGEYAVLD